MPSPSLRDIPLLRDIPPDVLDEVGQEIEWMSLPSGWTLFEAGETPEGLYFVVSGTLGAFRSLRNGERRLSGYIRSGEPVGEMALVAGEPRSHSVYAMRDTELLRLSRASFNRLVRAHPSLMQSLARVMMIRMRQQRRRNERAEPRIFCLIAASPTIDLRLRARSLQNSLAGMGVRCAVLGPDCEEVLATRLDAFERENDVIIVYTPIADTAWCRSCLRQADRLWVFARANALPSTPLLPQETSPALSFRLVDVVLLHFGADGPGASPEVWRQAAGAERLFHWRDFDEKDSQRLARVMSGQAVALVLSGGGARAYAHIGVVRAMRESRIPIDVVGGTSMGAVVAACVAMGWSDDEIDQRIRRAFVESNPLGDYVLPVVALAGGKRVEDRLQENFGEVCIEDLSLPFFSISTNLVSGRVETHHSGRLRDALRATISLPGLLPPVVDPDRGVLVDGAVLMNFPVDVMRARHRGPIVGVDVARRGVFDPKDFVDPPNFSQWVATKGFQRTPPIASLLMRVATLTVDPWEGRERTDVLITPEMPDVDLRDWKRYDEAVAAGYEAAAAALSDRAFLARNGAEPGGRARAPQFEAEQEGADQFES